MSYFLPIEIIIAYTVELLGGGTEESPHPVRIIGKVIVFFEQKLRRLRIPERLSGTILTFVIVAGTYLITYLITSVLGGLHGTIDVIIGTIILYYTFSIRGLVVEAQGVLDALEAGDIY